MNLFDATTIIRAGGYITIFAILFAETGILVGFFLPGDTLLFSAGFLASAGYLNLMALILVAFLAAVLGDSLGYGLGKKFGRKVFTRNRSVLLHPDNIRRAEKFYQQHDGKALIAARFVPLLRTIAPILAGVGSMRYRNFAIYNITGAALWIIGLSLIGYYLAQIIPNADRYVLGVVFGILALSVLPSVLAFIRLRLSKREQNGTPTY
ncbi:MAG: VTT domain-containing protein [Patescibacteria group bacterium]|nr:VTT domain-containing protein [Patescibacteria group bacterium]